MAGNARGRPTTMGAFKFISTLRGPRDWAATNRPPGSPELGQGSSWASRFGDAVARAAMCRGQRSERGEAEAFQIESISAPDGGQLARQLHPRTEK